MILITTNICNHHWWFYEGSNRVLPATLSVAPDKTWHQVTVYIIIIIIMFVYYSCSQNATTEPTSVTQDGTGTIERKASI